MGPAADWSARARSSTRAAHLHRNLDSTVRMARYACRARGPYRNERHRRGTVSDGTEDGGVTRTAVWVVVVYWIGTIPSPWVIARLAGRTDLIAEMKRRESPGDAHFIVSKKMSAAAGVSAIVLDIMKGFGPA